MSQKSDSATPSSERLVRDIRERGIGEYRPNEAGDIRAVGSRPVQSYLLWRASDAAVTFAV
jgi:hypothetical protein